MKVKNSIKKVGAVAGSALMVGLTMGSAAVLSDFPQPFVDDDGNVASQIVVGSNGNVADVVGAVNVAAALGQSAVQTEEQTASVAGGSYGWSASGGEALNTQNDDLYLGSNVNDVRSTLTADHLDVLESTTFQDDAGDQTDIEYYLYVGQQQVQFGETDDDEDPMLHVSNPAGVESGVSAATDYLYRMQANFEDGVVFAESDDVAEDVDSQEIELFGKTYVISADTNDNELVLLGSQEEVSLETGESGTLTIDGSDHDVEVVAVTGTNTAAFRVDGQLQQETEGGTFNVDGQQVRVDTVIQTNSQNSEGLVTFAVGSEQLTLEAGEPVQDDNGDDIDGTYVEFNGDDDNTADHVQDLSSIDVYVGTDDDDVTWVAAGESWSHPLFEQVEFRFGGLNPDAAEGGDGVGEVEFSTSGDDTATVSFTSRSGDSATLEWLFEDNNVLEDSDNQEFVVVEGAVVNEDEYFFSDAGDFAHMWQITDIDIDTQDEATVDLSDVVSGADVEADLDYNSGDTQYEGEEVIDGQTYHFYIDEGSESDVIVTWGENADFDDVGAQTTVYPALDLDSGAALAFTQDSAVGHTVTAQSDGVRESHTFVLPSTESTGAQTLMVGVTDGDTGTIDAGTYEYSVDGGNTWNTLGDGDGQQITVGQTDYLVDTTHDDSGAAAALTIDDIALDDGAGSAENPAALVVEPEDDNDAEHVYTIAPDPQADDEMEVPNVAYSGSDRDFEDLESNSDVEAAYDYFGAYTEYDSDDDGEVTLHIPDGQAVAGAAFTDQGGDLTAGGSGGSVTYEALAGMGALPDMARLDSEVTESVRSNNHLILVGGPAVNSLVSTLVDEDSVDLSEVADAESGAVLQVVNDAFASGQHALVVAGYEAADTRSAARYLANYGDHEQALEDADERLVLTEADYPSSQ